MWKLIGRTLSGEASQDEINELERLRNEDHHVNYYIEILSAWWNLAEREGKDEAEQAFEKLLANKKQNTPNQFLKRNLMRKNYFKLAWRNIIKPKSYTFISVTGLAFGICACIAVFLITDYKLGFNKFHPGNNSIYPAVGNMQITSGDDFENGVIAHYRQ